MIVINELRTRVGKRRQVNRGAGVLGVGLPPSRPVKGEYTGCQNRKPNQYTAWCAGEIGLIGLGGFIGFIMKVIAEVIVGFIIGGGFLIEH